MEKSIDAALCDALLKSTKLVGVSVPVDLNREQLDKLTNLLTCTDEEGVETWGAILEIFGH